jgi:hypothetical protein
LPDEVFAGLQIESGFDDKSGVSQPFNRGVQQAHFHQLLAAGDELAVVVKDDRGHGYVVEVPSVGLVELHPLHIEVRNHAEARCGISGFEILRLQSQWKVKDFILRKDRFLNFPFGDLARIVELIGGKVAAPGLDRVLGLSD